MPLSRTRSGKLACKSLLRPFVIDVDLTVAFAGFRCDTELVTLDMVHKKLLVISTQVGKEMR